MAVQAGLAKRVEEAEDFATEGGGMSAINFAIAYRQWLQKSQRSEREPKEPTAAQHGIEPELAESLRYEVRVDFERDVMNKAKGREHLK